MFQKMKFQVMEHPAPLRKTTKLPQFSYIFVFLFSVTAAATIVDVTIVDPVPVRLALFGGVPSNLARLPRRPASSRVLVSSVMLSPLVPR